MWLYAVGASHLKTPVAVRERLAVNGEQVPDVLASLFDRVGQAVLLSTCNRTEIYGFDQARAGGRDAVVDFMSARAGIPPDELRPYLYVHEGESAARHLFRVACGLDSMIVGEHEVLGQVGQALAGAEETGRAGLPLVRLFRHAVSTGRRVRRETGLSRNALSVGSVAVDLAARGVGRLADCRMLVIGAGEAARMVAKAARGRGASQMAVASRSQRRASVLADELGGRSVALSDLESALAEADVVVACADAPGAIVDRRRIEAAMACRPERPLVVIDIGVPRSVEIEVGHVSNVSLYDIDDLTQIVESNARLRRNEEGRAMEIVDAEVARYMAWLQAFAVRPTIVALTRMSEGIRRRHLDATLRRLRGLSDEEREGLEAMTKAIVKGMLYDPIRCLKRDCRGCGRQGCHATETQVQVLNELFQLDGAARRRPAPG
ncbi:MAG: glutamyl-tRNA reductase [Gemmatimonadetes bacterium]|nr:glutamyl-tRNA reductase [Gemmatimonadota bacterium]